MAVQMGIVPLQGTIGNINFYKSQGKFLAREKTGVTGDRIAIDPKFQRSRENAAEFAEAARAGKLIRTAFQVLVRPNRDTTMVRRLASKMISVLQTDTSSARGMRKVTNGQVELLEGFEFHEQASMTTTFFAPYSCEIARATGELRISIPSFIPITLVTEPQGATHFKLHSGAASVDFENGSYTSDVHSSPELVLNNLETDEIVFKNKVSANIVDPLFLVLGIEFFQQVNAWMYPLKDGAFNALAIVRVSGK